ncbi:alpha/beta hydrolase [Herminiimonas sp. KBW02]|uniref:alpha/beta hydrolase n=1 Tax=Herminiimonas sp. KBW02 TaxID=2153363 RepID=UPI000F5AED5A|nr:alpha/beta hydrolase [Herminiimonas sp. KBW02]RQO35901.1 alpha/beta hydrolase [Herminiimonas sp. KBW02]
MDFFYTQSDRRSRLLRYASLLVTGLLLSACAMTTGERYQLIVQEGKAAGFTPVSFGSAPPLTGLLRTQTPPQTSPAYLWIVIEGDGRAWLNMREPSMDPTPVDPVGWRLAKDISQTTVLYLARPCQYQSADELDACSVADWTDGRFAGKWVQRLNAAVDQAKRMTKARKIVLAGYSGGGVMAALVAAQRDDVALLMTVASPLDHAAWTMHHKVTPLSTSLSVVAVQQKLARLPQLHVVGADDKVVPPFLLQDFLRRYPSTTPAELVTLPGVDHRMRTPIDLNRIRSSRSLLPSIDGPGIYP